MGFLAVPGLLPVGLGSNAVEVSRAERASPKSHNFTHIFAVRSRFSDLMSLPQKAQSLKNPSTIIVNNQCPVWGGILRSLKSGNYPHKHPFKCQGG
jgi:hypothetical protein